MAIEARSQPRVSPKPSSPGIKSLMFSEYDSGPNSDSTRDMYPERSGGPVTPARNSLCRAKGRGGSTPDAERLRDCDLAVAQGAQDRECHQPGGTNEALAPHLQRRRNRDRRGSRIVVGRRPLRRSPAGLPLTVREHQVLLQPEGTVVPWLHASAEVLARPRRLWRDASASLRDRRLARLHAD